MRRFLMLSTCALASVVGVMPASACPAGDGTLPGSPSSVTRVGTADATPYTTIYIDDRDWADADEDGNAGGLWIYIETNGAVGLQRGGGHVSGLSGYLWPPYIQPIPVVPPNPGGLPILPNGLTLFPQGCCHPPGAQDSLWTDRCKTGEDGTVWTGEPDQILF